MGQYWWGNIHVHRKSKGEKKVIAADAPTIKTESGHTTNPKYGSFSSVTAVQLADCNMNVDVDLLYYRV